MKHGQILGGTLTTPDLDAALIDYRDRLGLRLVEQGNISAVRAAGWGCPANAGDRHAVLTPTSGAPCFIRLVEQPVPAGFRPTRTYGWAAFELTVQDVYGWPARLAGAGFEIVGPPKEIEGLPYFVAMQMTGRGREMIYLNEVRQDTPSSDLPRAGSPVDRIFIVILACPDRDAALAWYRDTLGLDVGGSYTIEYTMINKAFGLPDGHRTTITMVQKGRMPIVEVDGYPGAATVRAGDPGRLPPGNAMVALAVDSLDMPGVDFVAPPAPDIFGRPAAVVFGPAGERLELVEISGPA